MEVASEQVLPAKVFLFNGRGERELGCPSIEGCLGWSVALQNYASELRLTSLEISSLLATLANSLGLFIFNARPKFRKLLQSYREMREDVSIV